MDRYVDEQIQRAPIGGRMSDRVRGIATLLLRDGEPSASTTASRMKMSVRTLNRALAAEGTSYRAILDQLRHELACRHLVDSRLSICEIAFLLGFSDMSAFYRAFKRWTGRTPAEFRAQARSARPAL
jgi:AraC-like DNA-binding protein